MKGNSTNIFISWAKSGSASHAAAKILYKYAKKIHPELEPFFSDKIEKGADSLHEIQQAMDNAKAGIICVTKASQREPWLNYEAGYLHAKTDKVCTLLVDFASGEHPKAPLSTRQFTRVDMDDIVAMFESVVKACGFNSQSVIDRVNEVWDNMHQEILSAVEREKNNLQEDVETKVARVSSENAGRTMNKEEGKKRASMEMLALICNEKISNLGELHKKLGWNDRYCDFIFNELEGNGYVTSAPTLIPSERYIYATQEGINWVYDNGYLRK